MRSYRPTILYFQTVVILLVVFLHSSVAGTCANETSFGCLNGGVCMADECVCASGYSGMTCGNSGSSLIVLVVVCMLPLFTWSMVCCYGCSSLKKSKARRRQRQLQAENQDPSRDADDAIPLHDDPPGYYQAVYSNPIAICGLDENPDWTRQGEDSLFPPPHYEDLKFIHDHLSIGAGDRGDGSSVYTVENTETSAITSRSAGEVTNNYDSSSASSLPIVIDPSTQIVCDGLSIRHTNEQEPVHQHLGQPAVEEEVEEEEAQCEVDYPQCASIEEQFAISTPDESVARQSVAGEETANSKSMDSDDSKVAIATQ